MIGAWMLALMATAPAHGLLKRPSDATIGTMSADCDRLMALQSQIKIDSEAFLLLQRKAGFFETGSYDLSRLSAAELAEIAEESRKIGDARKEANELAADLLVRTARAYGVSDPNNPLSGRIHSGPPNRTDVPNAMPSYLGQEAVFAPKFDATLPIGKAGLTTDDGTVRLGWTAFEYPGKLAATLFHEKEHLHDLLASNRDLRNDAAVELRIRTAQRGAMVSVFELRTPDMDRYDEILRNLPAARAQWQELMNDGFDPYREDHRREVFSLIMRKAMPLEPSETSGRGFDMPEGLDEIRQRAALIDLMVRNEQSNRRRSPAVPVDPEVVAAINERIADGKAFSALEFLAERICRQSAGGEVPSPFAQEWASWRDEHYESLSRKNPWADLSTLSGPKDCTMFLENQVVVSRRYGLEGWKLDFDWARGVVWEAYRRSNPTTVQPAPPPPNQAYPDADDGFTAPQPPSIPYCRYHPWCKDPGKK